MPISKKDLDLLDEIEPIRCTESGAWIRRVLSVVGAKPSKLPPEKRPVVETVLEFASKELGADWIIAEPYTSTDWSDEYQSWYSRIFRRMPRSTTRFHFLRIGDLPFRLSKLMMKAGVFHLGQALDEGAATYLGYMVVRPFNIATTADGYAVSPTVGETVLAHPSLAKSPEPLAGAEKSVTRSFPKRPPSSFCHAVFKTHILGHELTVDGVPFIQQDQTVSVCAESDLWMVARLLHQRGEGARVRPSDMERSARETYSLGPAREGLDWYQVRGALDELGLNPEHLVPGNAADGLSTITAYTTGGLPVIASVVSKSRGETNPNHVITILGVEYGKHPEEWAKFHGTSAFKKGLTAASSYVKYVYAHDDASGPYRKLEVSVRSAAAGEAEGDDHERLLLGDYLVFDLFVPIPQRVHMRVEDVRLHANQWLGYNFLRPENLPGLGGRWAEKELTNLVLRGYLISGHALKREALRVAWRAVPHRTPPGGWGLEYYWRQRCRLERGTSNASILRPALRRLRIELHSVGPPTTGAVVGVLYSLPRLWSRRRATLEKAPRGSCSTITSYTSPPP